MPYLYEILNQKNLLNKKIKELTSILQYEQTDRLAQELFALLDLRQNKQLILGSTNANNKITIGGTELSIASAVIIRDNIKCKIDVLTSLINNKSCSLDKVELQEQRDKYYNEYILLSMCIDKNDLTVVVE